MAAELGVQGFLLLVHRIETIPNRPIITGATKGTDDRNDVEPPNPGRPHRTRLQTSHAGFASDGSARIVDLAAKGVAWR
jgi:hypothetical protein